MHAMSIIISINTIMYVQWLKDDFLGYLDAWKRSVQGRTNFSKIEHKMMLISPETLTGLRMTGIIIGKLLL